MASSISQHLSLENPNLNKIQQSYFVSCSTMVDLLGRSKRCPFPMALQGRFFPQNLLVKTMHFMSPSAWKRSRSFWMQAKALEEWSFSVCFSCHCLKTLGHGMIWTHPVDSAYPGIKKQRHRHNQHLTPTNYNQITIWLFNIAMENHGKSPFFSSVNHLFRLGPSIFHGELLVITRG